MSRITVDELVYLLAEQDPDARFLFVEGVRDSRFWSIVVPFSQRISVIVAPIGMIEMPGCAGGERGRALALAETLSHSPVAQKVLFFLDADNDLLLQNAAPARVTFTDYRDLETYVLEGECLRTWLYGVGKDPDNVADFKQEIIAALKELGLIRAADAFAGSQLSFTKAFVSRADKCLINKDNQKVVDTDRLLTTLFAQAKLDGQSQNSFKETLEELRLELSDRPGEWYVAGKDLVAYLAAVFKMAFDDAFRLIHACLVACLETIRHLPKFASVEEFVRG